MQYKKAIIVVAIMAVASVASYFYLGSQLYYPVVQLTLPDGLSLTAVLPETKERTACRMASDRFVDPLKQSCKECKVAAARCERHLEGLELAMREGAPVPHPVVVARELRMAVLGPPEAAKAGCQVLAANMVANGEKTAVCVPPTPPKS